MTDAEQKELMARLADNAESLAALLRDPQPGHITWAEAVRDKAKFIADWWQGKMAKRG